MDTANYLGEIFHQRFIQLRNISKLPEIQTMNMEVQKNVLLQEAENWEFRELFVAYSNIEGTNWRGVLTQKKDIVLASLVKMGYLQTITVIIILIIVAIYSFIIIRILLEKPLNDIKDQAYKLEKCNLEKSHYKYSDAEVGNALEALDEGVQALNSTM